MKLIYAIAADVLSALGWEVEINEKENYWNLVLTNTTSSEDMPESHKSCLRGLLRGWLMEFNYEGGRQQVNIYKELYGLDPEDDRYSCLDTCANQTDDNTPQYKLNDKEIFVRRKDRFDRYVLAEPIDEPLTTRLTCGSKFNPDNKPEPTQETNSRLIDEDTYQALRRLGILDTSVRAYNRGTSDYSRHIIQPWTIWQDYNLNPWDADIVKRILRTKHGDSRRLDYEKIIHICEERIRQIDTED